jgi:hypothetical protein
LGEIPEAPDEQSGDEEETARETKRGNGEISLEGSELDTEGIDFVDHVMDTPESETKSRSSHCVLS